MSMHLNCWSRCVRFHLILYLAEYQTLQVNEWLSHRTGIEVKHLDLLAYTFACARASFQVYQTPVLPDYDACSEHQATS
jgi:hypothetical protein